MLSALSYVSSECGPSVFECNNGLCIDFDLINNDVDDCGDFSDECKLLYIQSYLSSIMAHPGFEARPSFFLKGSFFLFFTAVLQIEPLDCVTNGTCFCPEGWIYNGSIVENGTCIKREIRHYPFEITLL